MLKTSLSWLINAINKTKIPNVQNEHFVPYMGLELEPYILQKDIAAVHHLIRYYWALRIIENLPSTESILDVACGGGYGSYLLSEKFPNIQVVGADYDKAAIKKAREIYKNDNLYFIVGDVLEWEKTIGNKTFDIITSFDTLEHVPHREIMLENIVQHLSKEGKLFLSTPCGTTDNILFPAWQSHKIEFSYISLYDLMKRYFNVVLPPDDIRFPHIEIFIKIKESGIDYYNLMNPVVCEQPIQINNPYRHDLID